MAQTGIFHHVGTFLLFAAAILLLIVTISAPVINDVSLLKVTLTNRSDIRNSSVTFGTFGHCVLDVAPARYVFPFPFPFSRRPSNQFSIPTPNQFSHLYTPGIQIQLKY